jgi:hypothetical protein
VPGPLGSRDRPGRERVAANCGEPVSRCTQVSLLAHEMGLAFQEYWKVLRVGPP